MWLSEKEDQGEKIETHLRNKGLNRTNRTVTWCVHFFDPLVFKIYNRFILGTPCSKKEVCRELFNDWALKNLLQISSWLQIPVLRNLALLCHGSILNCVRRSYLGIAYILVLLYWWNHPGIQMSLINKKFTKGSTTETVKPSRYTQVPLPRVEYKNKAK